MKSMDGVRNALLNIGALAEPHPDPTRKPRTSIPPENITELRDGVPVFDAETPIEYPDWVDAEIFDRLQNAIVGESNGTEGGIGIDALAWYVSFHHEGAGWGIYVPVSSLAYLHKREFASQRGDTSRAFQVGLTTLLAHEFVHFAVDYACAQWEILLRTPCWNSLVADRKASNVPYLHSEEKLANAAMMRNCHNLLTGSERQALRRFVSSQPLGYRDAPTVLEQDAFEHTFSEVLKLYVGMPAAAHGLDLCTPAFDHFVHFPQSEAYMNAGCPIHIIHDETSVGLPWLKFLRSLRVIDETDGFKKSLEKLHSDMKKKWATTKERIARDGELSRGSLNFKEINGEYSIRLNDNCRVHLKPCDSKQLTEGWVAIRVGTHKEMGHG